MTINNAQKPSKLMQKLTAGEFIVTGELEPGRTTSMEGLLYEAEAIKPYVTAVNITDNPGSFVTMDGLSASIIIKEKTGIEPIYQLTARDKNRLGLASAFLGAIGSGIQNILTLSGDHTSLGDVPQTKPVFDLDSAQLLHLGRQIIDEHSIYGNPLEIPKKDKNFKFPKAYLGIGANPNSTDPEIELAKIKRKINLSVDFIQTQVIYDIDNKNTQYFFEELKKFNVPIIVGLFPMKNYNTARDFNKYIPGVSIPEQVLNDLKEVKKETWNSKKDKHAAYDKINVELFKPLIERLKNKGYAAGVHITAVGYSRIFPKLFN